MRTQHKLALSVDVDEWYHSRRWVDGNQAEAVPDHTALFRRLYGQDRPAGEVVGPTLALLDLFDRYRCDCTFFLLGEIVQWYPDLVAAIADRGHEIACHGMHHVDMTVVGPTLFARQLEETCRLIENVAGTRPVGFRAPNLVYEPWATRILEDHGFVYDSTVCASRSIGGKYKGWADAPVHPYHPSYHAIGRRGDAKLVELPIPSFPYLKIAAGSGIMTRVIGLHWTLSTLAYHIRSGNTVFYFHPWEVGTPPRPEGHRLRNALFLRRTGPWMMRGVERIVRRFAGRIVTTRESAEAMLQREALQAGALPQAGPTTGRLSARPAVSACDSAAIQPRAD